MPVDGVGPAQQRADRAQIRRDEESAQQAREQRAKEEAQQPRTRETDGSVDITA